MMFLALSVITVIHYRPSLSSDYLFQLFIYRFYGNASLGSNIGLLFLNGVAVNAPYALITTAISADLVCAY